MNITKNRKYYSISEVCRLLALEQHVLRYWETEFSNLKPKKNRSGNRAYQQKDIELIKKIKTLLYDDKYTIEGAKKKISENKNKTVFNSDFHNTVRESRNELIKILKEIDDNLKGKL